MYDDENDKNGIIRIVKELEMKISKTLTTL
jgi:hypothetical protein